MTLDELRKEWERGERVYSCGTVDSHITVTKADEKYTCYRYFKLVDDWTVSLDHQGTDDKTAMSWLASH